MCLSPFFITKQVVNAIFKICFRQVFKTLDKEEFLNVLSGGKKVVNRSKNFEPKKLEPKVKDEDDKETW